MGPDRVQGILETGSLAEDDHGIRQRSGQLGRRLSGPGRGRRQRQAQVSDQRAEALGDRRHPEGLAEQVQADRAGVSSDRRAGGL